MRGPARAAQPVDIPTSRRRPRHRDPPRRSDHRRRHRSRPGRRATRSRRARPSQPPPMPPPPNNCTASAKPPDTTSRSPGALQPGTLDAVFITIAADPEQTSALTDLYLPPAGAHQRSTHANDPHDQHQDQRGASAVERVVARVHGADAHRGARRVPVDLLGQDRPQSVAGAGVCRHTLPGAADPDRKNRRRGVRRGVGRGSGRA